MKPVRFEREYEATLQELWDLWATADGFAAWWGPEGFRVEVHEWDFRVQGALRYDMIADAPEQIAAMQEMNMSLSHATHGVFAAIEPITRLVLRHVIDFLPGIAPYENDITVMLSAKGTRCSMLVEIQPHPDPHWTEMSAQGFTSQLNKLPKALDRRRGRA